MAALVGAGDAADVVLTSGGTEADLLGVWGLGRAAAAAGAPARALVVATEHRRCTARLAALAAHGFAVDRIAVDRDSRVDLDDLGRALRPGAAVVAVAAVNHETGGSPTWRQWRPRRGRPGRASISTPCRRPAAWRWRRSRPWSTPWRCRRTSWAAPGRRAVDPPGVELAPLVTGGHQERGRRPAPRT
ncbi:MAG: aminotransferase class V-fold PLP-dependent enzyme [Kofleriaceae bacterium]|nr:aminotransferase class V-fold PLP-dependent enzyme [Kofleriaceae bacterium]